MVGRSSLVCRFTIFILGTLENPETRYTLECYPPWILMASAALGDRKSFSGD